MTELTAHANGDGPSAAGEQAESPTFWNRVYGTLKRWDDLSRGYLEKRYGRRPEAEAHDVDYNPEIELVEHTMADMSFEQMTGFQRLRCIYFKEHGFNTVENAVLYRTFLAAGLSGALIGGLLGQKESASRFGNYAVGRDLGNARNAMRRKMDYYFLMFLKNGLRSGIRVGLVGGLSVWTVINVTTYRNKYCSYYFPLTTALFSSLMMARGGTIGLFYGFGFGLLPGLGLSASVLAYSYYHGKTANGGYWLMRETIAQEMQQKEKEEEKIRRLMVDENIYFKWYAKLRLQEIEAENAKNMVDGNELSIIKDANN